MKNIPPSLNITPNTRVLPNDTISSHPQQEPMTQLGNQQVIQTKIIKGQTNSGPPKICIPTRGEIEIRRKFPRELKDRTSGMMLKVGWSAQNDNDQIRTFISQCLISLKQRVIDKERLSTSCFDEYEEEIDE
ncbi:MAG: hypothetical protein EZS28_040054 [Streblomastix strix]|uniref:Uncharacterized protein n=1 Tax=Streblomastix strix TaxID=222440 RepID=A0A5J4U2A1_9EUKA|nr:MAG: hypothetical protein EZS28_040054 [Streblomastix strix]